MADFTLGSKLRHPAYGEGVIIDISEFHYRIYFREHGDMELGKAFDGFQLLEAGKGANMVVPIEDAVEALKNIFDMYYDVTEHVDLGDRWTGGQLILQPKDTSLKPKEIPIESFFHKIVMLRDRLRVLEQRSTRTRSSAMQRRLKCSNTSHAFMVRSPHSMYCLR